MYFFQLFFNSKYIFVRSVLDVKSRHPRVGVDLLHGILVGGLGLPLLQSMVLLLNHILLGLFRKFKVNRDKNLFFSLSVPGGIY